MSTSLSRDALSYSHTSHSTCCHKGWVLSSREDQMSQSPQRYAVATIMAFCFPLPARADDADKTDCEKPLALNLADCFCTNKDRLVCFFSSTENDHDPLRTLDRS